MRKIQNVHTKRREEISILSVSNAAFCSSNDFNQTSIWNFQNICIQKSLLFFKKSEVGAGYYSGGNHLTERGGVGTDRKSYSGIPTPLSIREIQVAKLEYFGYF